MQVVDEKPETLHIYVVREELPRPSLLPVVLSALALSVLFALCVFSPDRQPERRVTIRVPAVFLPLKTLSVSVPIIPTGVKTYPATAAHGLLTITNGSVISQELPKGLIFTGKGVEVITEAAVFVPAGSALGYGLATVSSRAIVAGKAGNIAALTINAVYETSLYIRNLTAFRDGKDAYSVKIVTQQDRQTAGEKAQGILGNRITSLLSSPCKESRYESSSTVEITRTCQFFTYSVSPLVHVTRAKLSGKTVIVEGFLVARPQPFSGK